MSRLSAWLEASQFARQLPQGLPLRTRSAEGTTLMVFKEPRTQAETKSLAQKRDACMSAAHALDSCNVEPEMSNKLKNIATQMDDAIRRGRYVP